MARFKLEEIEQQNPTKFFTKPVIGLDRDGVINVDRGNYTWRKDDFEMIPGSAEAVAMLRNHGHKLAIITNQGGIGKGLYTEQDVTKLHDHMFELFGQAGCPSVDAVYFSESSAKDDYYAKPNVGMFKRCEEENPLIKFSKGFYVGDKLSDLKAAVKVGARPILVRTGYGLETEKELKKFTYQKIKKQTKIFDNLYEFASYIVSG